MFDVVNEFIRLLKNLRFVFSRQVVKSRISQRLSKKQKQEQNYFKYLEQQRRTLCNLQLLFTHWFPDGDDLTEERSWSLG